MRHQLVLRKRNRTFVIVIESGERKRSHLLPVGRQRINLRAGQYTIQICIKVQKRLNGIRTVVPLSELRKVELAIEVLID